MVVEWQKFGRSQLEHVYTCNTLHDLGRTKLVSCGFGNSNTWAEGTS